MKKRFTIVAMLLYSCSIQAQQVLVNVQLPATGLTMKSQLWSVSLMNPAPVPKDVQVEMTFSDAATNQRVLTAVTRVFRLPAGLKQLTLQDISPVIYTVNNPAYNVDSRPEGFLPAGSFQVCYTVLNRVEGVPENLGNECDRIDIEPLAPPMLVSPADSEQVELDRPPFNWIPPAPATLFSQLLYDWTLVEVKPLQTGAQAIQQNIPLLLRSNIAATNFQYPMSFPGLETGKLYAWQVAAKNNSSVIAKTDVWTFSIKPPGKEAGQPGGYYTRLKKLDDAAYVICNGILNYEYVNELNDSLATVTVTDISANSRKAIQAATQQVPLQFGQNFIQLDVRELGMIHKHIYQLELLNSANEKWYIKFEYRKQN